MTNVQVRNTDSLKLSVKDSYSVTSAIIAFQMVGRVTIKNLQSDNDRGVAILSVVDCSSFSLDGGLYDWTASSIGPLIKDINNDTSAVGQPILLPINNRIPASSACASRKVDYKSFSQLFLYVAKFTYGVSL